MNSPPNNNDSSDHHVDDYEVMGIRQTRYFTSLARWYASLTVNDRLDLRQLDELADSLHELEHILDLLTILAMTLTAKLRYSRSVSLLFKACRIIIAFLVIVESELDILSKVEFDIRALRSSDLPPLRLYPNQNRTIDSLDPSFAYQYTRFTKDQLHQLKVHLRIPTSVYLPRRRYRFTGEELLVVCLAKIATGDPWNRLIPANFGGGLARWSDGFDWFVNHIFVQFYHKTSGMSLPLWSGQIDDFRQAIHEN